MSKQYLDKTGLTYLWGKIKSLFAPKNRGIEYIRGTWTAASGTWTGVSEDSELYDGKQIILYMPFAGSGNATLNLTLADGSTTGAKNVYYESTTRFTTHKGQNSQLPLIYHKAQKLSDGTTYEGWWYIANRNTTYTNMTQAEATTGTATTARNISAKVLNDTIANKITGKQDKLTAGTNITIDSNNVISASGGGSSVTVDSALSSTSTNPVQNKVINTALGQKAPTSHASSATTYGIGTSSNYGHVKLSDSYTSTTDAASGGTAATPKAVKNAIDVAKNYIDGHISWHRAVGTTPIEIVEYDCPCAFIVVAAEYGIDMFIYMAITRAVIRFGTEYSGGGYEIYYDEDDECVYLQKQSSESMEYFVIKAY